MHGWKADIVSNDIMDFLIVDILIELWRCQHADILSRTLIIQLVKDKSWPVSDNPSMCNTRDKPRAEPHAADAQLAIAASLLHEQCYSLIIMCRVYTGCYRDCIGHNSIAHSRYKTQFALALLLVSTFDI